MAQGSLAVQWRRIDRVTPLPQLPWPEYREATAKRAADIMSASLDPSEPRARANQAHRPARTGAALLVSDPEVYAPPAEERALGMLVDLDPDRWVRAIADPPGDPTASANWQGSIALMWRLPRQPHRRCSSSIARAAGDCGPFASTERRYRWRRAVAAAEFDDRGTPTRRRLRGVDASSDVVAPT
jgi:hypothetical protein